MTYLNTFTRVSLLSGGSLPDNYGGHLHSNTFTNGSYTFYLFTQTLTGLPGRQITSVTG